MAKINLLPWREELRQERKQRFLIMLGASAVASLVLVFFMGTYIDGQVDTQRSRNQFVQKEINGLNSRIAEIKNLKKRREELLERMGVIQSLQGNRPVIVRVFDELVRVAPDGVYFTFLDMRGNNITIKGIAESNNRISALMRQFDESEWFDGPNLTAVKALGDGRGSSFDLTVLQVTPKREDES
ncbi:type 4a pilus biogenesis protein PilN [Kistimonas scapharcae]|uniref:Type 4a pilus biogenesis protein PilN n=1 Tax=Kistimonas scapharcae TaxID=1036133 RepID=A0ABP8UX07_9GAMM